MDQEENLISDSKMMADMLSMQYSSMFSIPTTNIKREEVTNYFEYTADDSNDRGAVLDDIIIDYDRVRLALSKLSSQSSPGPDGVPADCLKHGGSEMSSFLVKLYRQSMDNSDLPILTRTGRISPVYKAGDKSLPKNYRPISLTTHVSKVFERVVRPQIVDFLEAMGLTDETNHGSRPGRSTLSQLLEQYDWTLETLVRTFYDGQTAGC